MRYLGVFEKELPGEEKTSYSDIFFLKMTSPIYDRYELRLSSHFSNYEETWRKVYNDSHGLITCQHRLKGDDFIRATTVFSRYSKRKSYTATCKTLQQAIDLVVENYLRHVNASAIPHDPECFWEPCTYNGKEFFNFSTGECYYSGYRRHTGRVYVKDDSGRSVLCGDRMSMEEAVGYFRTLKRLGK